MKSSTSNTICAVAAVTAGGMAFAAAKAMTGTKAKIVRKTTGKAIKAIGAVIESLQM